MIAFLRITKKTTAKRGAAKKTTGKSIFNIKTPTIQSIEEQINKLRSRMDLERDKQVKAADAAVKKTAADLKKAQDKLKTQKEK